MHLKLVVLFAVVAVCSARSLLTTGDYFVNIDKDNIVIRGKYGRQMDIFFDRMYPEMYGKRMIQIHVNGADMPLKTYKVMDFEVMAEGVYQSDILLKIFSQFVGQLDEQMCEKLMGIITKYVQMHQIHPVFLQALKFLCYEDFALMDMDMDMTYNYDQYMPYNKLGFMYGKMGYNMYDTKYNMNNMYDNKYNMYNMYDNMRGMRMHTYDMPMYNQMYSRMSGMMYNPMYSRMSGMTYNPMYSRMSGMTYNPMYRQMYGQTYGTDMSMMNMRMQNYMPSQWWNLRYNTLNQYRDMDYNTLPYNMMKMY